MQFRLHAGEVLGIAGLVGAGHELARLIFAADPRTQAPSKGWARPSPNCAPGDAIRAGVVYLTEDRKAQGLFLDMSVADNINVCACVTDAHAGGVLDRRHAAQSATDAIKSLSIRVARARSMWARCPVAIRKVLLARLLEVKPHVLILDEPTRGVDIGSKSEIYRIINQLAQAGVALW